MNWVLIVVFINSRGGVGVVQQPFANHIACEAARAEVVKAHDKDGYLWVKSQGCYALSLHDRSGKPLT